jgi:hypothetical protein
MNRKGIEKNKTPNLEQAREFGNVQILSIKWGSLTWK